ncbi:hypothetical protein G6F65_018511 [Rhizopus arrhizus]|nr:hypothetical protein G6F65_018511 [Rhizopus arrhizus]
MAVAGPNCMGFSNLHTQAHTAFDSVFKTAPAQTGPGVVSLLTQSGNVCAAVVPGFFAVPGISGGRSTDGNRAGLHRAVARRRPLRARLPRAGASGQAADRAEGGQYRQGRAGGAVPHLRPGGGPARVRGGLPPVERHRGVGLRTDGASGQPGDAAPPQRGKTGRRADDVGRAGRDPGRQVHRRGAGPARSARIPASGAARRYSRLRHGRQPGGRDG